MPSYGFVSLANAVVMNGLKCVFVDCDFDSMTIDPRAIELAISSKTKAIITINYGGLSCDYDPILDLCRKHGLILIEDNAHGLGSAFKGRELGSIGHISTFSFDRLKNISCYEGGAVSCSNVIYAKRLEQISAFGTNRPDYFKGLVDHYEWIRPGTNASLASPLVAILRTQLERSVDIISTMRKHWSLYHKLLSDLQMNDKIRLPIIPDYCNHNGYMFWIKVSSIEERNLLIGYVSKNNVDARSHYFPLHQSVYGKAVGEFRGQDINTTKESGRLIRLPLFYEITDEQIEYVVRTIATFFHQKTKPEPG